MLSGSCWQWITLYARRQVFINTFMITWIFPDSYGDLCQDSCQWLIQLSLEFVSFQSSQKMPPWWLLTTARFLGPLPGHRCFFPGIYHEPNCSSSVVTHAMLVVGYGFEGREEDGRKYWLVKNRYRLLRLLSFRWGEDFSVSRDSFFLGGSSCLHDLRHWALSSLNPGFQWDSGLEFQSSMARTWSSGLSLCPEQPCHAVWSQCSYSATGFVRF